jgi:hypothetical protein
MRLIYAFLVLLFIATSVDAKECVYEKVEPSDLYIGATKILYPELDGDNLDSIAGMHEVADEYALVADDEKKSTEDRERARRTEQAILSLAVVSANTYLAIPRMLQVLEKMKAEKENGLEKVSKELEPEVRTVARTMLNIGTKAGNVSSELTLLNAEIAVVKLNRTHIDGAKSALAQLDRTICSFNVTNDIFSIVARLMPKAFVLATVEHLNY